MNRDKLFAERREAARAALDAAGVPALLVTNLKNVRYLTGFSGSNAALLLTVDGRGLLGTDGRYTTQVVDEAPGVDVVIERDAVRAVREAYTGEIGIEASIGLGVAQRLENYVVTHDLIEELRLTKDVSEVAALDAAAAVADKAWLSLLDDGVIAEGVPENVVAAELEYRMRMFGADGISFETIVASGVNAAKPHHSASTDRIVKGLVTIDFGVYLDGYASDQTRLVSVGEPPEKQREIADTVYRSFQAGCEALKPGAHLFTIDKVCRDIIEDMGYGEYFVHSTGHGVGLDVHERPYAAPRTDPSAIITAGQTLTIEPGIYVPGVSGARIENTLVVTDQGSRPVNTSSTELAIV
ncbi:aminopeptidase P family protein [Corynebacterium kroppenstedtii]|uniref:aminopeptidase P family protein n=1 Tax=Corynebacterium sp. PCR 32 TaxID=3351342 RepID=UPI003097900F